MESTNPLHTPIVPGITGMPTIQQNKKTLFRE
jgi:hypothetical protein